MENNNIINSVEAEQTTDEILKELSELLKDCCKEWPIDRIDIEN